jgi:hypothetical protein
MAFLLFRNCELNYTLATSDSKDGVRRFFYMDVKTAVDSGRLNLVARQKAMDGEDILKTGMNCRRFGTTPVPAHFGYFCGVKSNPAVGTVYRRRQAIIKEIILIRN